MADAVLAVHVLAGVVALGLGPAAMYAARRRGPGSAGLEGPYHHAVLAVCASAALLAVLDWPQLWFFVPIAAGSYGFALLAYLARKRRDIRWLSLYVRGLGGSYIALVTAVLVVSVGSPLSWVVPSLVGAPMILWVARRVERGRDAPPDGRITCGRGMGVSRTDGFPCDRRAARISGDPVTASQAWR